MASPLPFVRSENALLKNGIAAVAKTCCCGSSDDGGCHCIGAVGNSMPTLCARVIFEDVVVPHDQCDPPIEGSIWVPEGRELNGSYCLTRDNFGWGYYNTTNKYQAFGAYYNGGGLPYGWHDHIPDGDVYADVQQSVVIGDAEGWYERLAINVRYDCVAPVAPSTTPTYRLYVDAWLQALNNTDTFRLFYACVELDHRPVCGEVYTVQNQYVSPLIDRTLGASRVCADQPDFVGDFPCLYQAYGGTYDPTVGIQAPHIIPFGYDGTATVTILDPDKLCCPGCRSDFADCCQSPCVELKDDNDAFTGRYGLAHLTSSDIGYQGGIWRGTRTDCDSGIVTTVEIFCIGGFWVLFAYKPFELGTVNWVLWYAEQPSGEWGDCIPIDKARWTRVGDPTFAPNASIEVLECCPAECPEECCLCCQRYTFLLTHPLGYVFTIVVSSGGSCTYSQATGTTAGVTNASLVCVEGLWTLAGDVSVVIGTSTLAFSFEFTALPVTDQCPPTLGWIGEPGYISAAGADFCCEGCGETECAGDCDACCDTITFVVDDHLGNPQTITFQKDNASGEPCSWELTDYTGDLTEANLTCSDAVWLLFTFWDGVVEVSFNGTANSDGCPTDSVGLWSSIAAPSVMHSVTLGGCA